MPISARDPRTRGDKRLKASSLDMETSRTGTSYSRMMSVTAGGVKELTRGTGRLRRGSTRSPDLDARIGRGLRREAHGGGSESRGGGGRRGGGGCAACAPRSV